ncbi:hypothetical protein T484DRAFT_1828525 [Baffinella frigidus]|nr:hypothetical protein T484DRAFT_1828525 [Cryptophyta sp. CCMP2293]
MRSISLLLLALPVSLSFVGVGPVVYASSGDDDCVTQGETAAPSKEAADGPETLRTVGMTGARIDYERDATGSEKGPATAQRPRGSAGRVGSQWVVRGEGSAGGVSWRNEAAGSRNSRMVAAGRIGSAEARVARKREETLADVVRRGGSIGCGVRAVKRLGEFPN